MISATQFRNYVNKDPCLDFIQLYCDPETPRQRRKQKRRTSLATQGVLFEDYIFTKIRARFDCFEGEQLSSSSEEINEVIRALRHEVIIHPRLADRRLGLKGIPDFIIRSDVINRLTTEPSRPSSSSELYYIPIDVKFAGLVVSVKNPGVLLNHGNTLAYKCQVIVYLKVLNVIQKRRDCVAFLLGKSWGTYNLRECYDPFHALGAVDMRRNEACSGTDIRILDVIRGGQTWWKSLRRHGDEWLAALNSMDLGQFVGVCESPIRRELYPNMSNYNVYSSHHIGIRNQLARKIGDLSLLWYIGDTLKTKAQSRNVYSLYDPRCTIDVFDGAPVTRSTVISKMIRVNQGRLSEVENNTLMETTQRDLRREITDYFVDFETINTGIVFNTDYLAKACEQIIFLIGVTTQSGVYYSFTADDLTPTGECDALCAFFNFIQPKEPKEPKQPQVRIVYWYAEHAFLMQSIRRNRHLLLSRGGIDVPMLLDSIVWLDLHKVFVDNQLVYKNCFKYGLKDIATALRERTHIKISFPKTCVGDDIQGGLDAMYVAYDYYAKKKQRLEEPLILYQIIKYNRFDAHVLYEIFTYLKSLPSSSPTPPAPPAPAPPPIQPKALPHRF
jgi:hypothetical protein